jgi:PhnB protein
MTMPQLTAYLSFDGNCGEAMRFYEKVLNEKITVAWSDSFWAEGFGMLKDRFGTPWIVNGGMKEL